MQLKTILKGIEDSSLLVTILLPKNTPHQQQFDVVQEASEESFPASGLTGVVDADHSSMNGMAAGRGTLSSSEIINVPPHTSHSLTISSTCSPSSLSWASRLSASEANARGP